MLERAARELGVSAAALRLGPSDDYELVLAIDPAARAACEAIARAADVSLAWVGRFTERAGERVWVEADDNGSGSFDILHVRPEESQSGTD